MIKGTFRLGGDIVEAIVKNENIMFNDTSTGTMTTIEGLKLSKAGVTQEFPDLEGDEDWKKKAIDRFKDYASKFKTEEEKLNYIRSELAKHGYEPLHKQRAGWRPKKF